MNKEQIELKSILYKIINHCFCDNALFSLGFGSFWQKYDQLTASSDIDFFILLKKFPNLNDLMSFNDLLLKYQVSIRYQLSCHLFVGSIHDIVCGEDNIIRILNIYSSGKDSPVIIWGDESINLLEKVGNYEENIENILRQNLFRTTRFFLQQFISSHGNINQNTLCEKYKQLIRFSECYEFVNEQYLHNKKNAVISQIRNAFKLIEFNSFNTNQIYSLIKQINDIVIC